MKSSGIIGNKYLNVGYKVSNTESTIMWMYIFWKFFLRFKLEKKPIKRNDPNKIFVIKIILFPLVLGWNPKRYKHFEI